MSSPSFRCMHTAVLCECTPNIYYEVQRCRMNRDVEGDLHCRLPWTHVIDKYATPEQLRSSSSPNQLKPGVYVIPVN